MNPMLYAIPVFMASILFEAWVARRRAPGAYDIPDALTSLHFGILSQVWGAFTRVIGFGVYVLAFEHLRVTTLPGDSVRVWIFALLFYDFCYYWAHRAGHEINLFWASHQVHHSSEYYNLTTALRQTATGGFTSWPFYVVMAVAGVPPMVFAVVGLIDLLYQYWVHTELVGKLGWLDRVFVTPSNHRVHHGQNDYCIDRNYGGILIVWDRLFGTFVEERDDERIVYGVRKPLASYNAAWGNLNVWTDVLRASLTAPSLGGALRAWSDPPQGRGVALPHLDTTQVRRFDTGTRPAVRRYALAQYLLLAPMVMHFLAIIERLDRIAGVAYALVITGTVVCVGWALEERPWACNLERLRVAALGIALLLLPDWFGWAA
ncbi:MAG: sterol desaturase family protein, partial [Gammaproteobacteria bacterium]|nr:sterol desaturase family protein [Gammaproteobacteria bacterium]